MTWRPLYEASPDDCDVLRRVTMAGYLRDSGTICPYVGEAFWGNPDGRHSRWIWAEGSDVINALAFQDLPDFPIPNQNTIHAVGRPLE